MRPTFVHPVRRTLRIRRVFAMLFLPPLVPALRAEERASDVSHNALAGDEDRALRSCGRGPFLCPSRRTTMLFRSASLGGAMLCLIGDVTHLVAHTMSPGLPRLLLYDAGAGCWSPGSWLESGTRRRPRRPGSSFGVRDTRKTAHPCSRRSSRCRMHAGSSLLRGRAGCKALTAA